MGKAGKSGGKSSIWRGVPRWARVCTVFGVVLMRAQRRRAGRHRGADGPLRGRGRQGRPLRRPGGRRQGDARATSRARSTSCWSASTRGTPTTAPLADSIMVLHVPASMDQAYLFSMPRDLYVDIPAFEKAELPRRHRPRSTPRCRTAASVPGKNPDAAQGFELLATTVQKRDRHQAVRRRRDHQLHRLPEDRRRDGRRRHVHRAGGAVRAPAAGRHSTGQGKPVRRGLRRPAGGLQEGHPPPQRLAGAGLRPAAVPEERRARTPTTAGSGTSSSSSRRWSARRSAPTW